MKLQIKHNGIIIEVADGTSFDECYYREVVEAEKKTKKRK